jgi:hypothetical protein
MKIYAKSRLAKVTSLTFKLEACDTADEVATVLEQNKSAIVKIFKISESEIASCIRDVRAIGKLE